MSKSALLLSPCISWAGPQAQWYDEDKVDSADTEKRDDGTAFHEAIHHYLSTGVRQRFNLRDLDVWMEHAIQYVETVLRPRCDSIQSEVAISVNWATGEAEVLPGVVGRGYPERPGWQNGTADLVCILKDGSLLVADWKTGGTDGAEEQLLSLGYGLQEAMQHDGPESSWVYEGPKKRPLVTICLQVNEHGVWPHEVEVSPEALQAHADAMRFQWEDIGKRNDPQPGVHCTALYCPHLAYCKGIAGVVADMAVKGNMLPTNDPIISPADLVRYRVTDKPMTDEEAGYTQAMVSAANRQAKYLTAANKDRVKAGGKVTSGQYEWAEGGNGYRWRKVNAS